MLMLGADLRTPFHHHREGQPPLEKARGADPTRLPHLAWKIHEELAGADQAVEIV
jgi:hypothetical protein